MRTFSSAALAAVMLAAATAGEAAAASDPGRIAFQSDRDGNLEIYSMAPDGTDVRRLTDSPGADSAPAISPDGRTIAFVSTRGGDADVWVMAADGSGPEPLITGAGTLEAAPVGRPTAARWPSSPTVSAVSARSSASIWRHGRSEP